MNMADSFLAFATTSPALFTISPTASVKLTFQHICHFFKVGRFVFLEIIDILEGQLWIEDGRNYTCYNELTRRNKIQNLSECKVFCTENDKCIGIGYNKEIPLCIACKNEQMTLEENAQNTFYIRPGKAPANR